VCDYADELSPELRTPWARKNELVLFLQ